jgi:hypothetical protein
MSEKQPRFSMTVTYTDDQVPGYHAGTLAAVAKWLGRQVNVDSAQIARVTPARRWTPPSAGRWPAPHR